MSDVIIRPITKDDAETFFALRLEALQNNPEAYGSNYEDSVKKWTAESYTASRVPDVGSDDFIVTAELDGKLVGMIGFYRDTYPKERHIGTIWGVYTAPAARRQGIGKKMLQAISDHAKNCDALAVINVAVITENQAAIKLYESVGFKAWGTQPDALRDTNTNKSYDSLWMSYQIE